MIERYKGIPIDRMLIRPLRIGEQFKVMPAHLGMRNSNEYMRSLAGQWLTVMDIKENENTGGRWRYYDPIYRDPFYADTLIPFDYSVEEHEDGFIEHWYDYHMDIYATNLRLIDKDNKRVKLTEPNLPTI